MNNDQEIILAKISAVYDKPPFVKMETGQMEMILKCVGLGAYYDKYREYLEPYWYNGRFQNPVESYRIFVGLNSIFEDLLNERKGDEIISLLTELGNYIPGTILSDEARFAADFNKLRQLYNLMGLQIVSMEVDEYSSKFQVEPYLNEGNQIIQSFGMERWLKSKYQDVYEAYESALNSFSSGDLGAAIESCRTALTGIFSKYKGVPFQKAKWMLGMATLTGDFTGTQSVDASEMTSIKNEIEAMGKRDIADFFEENLEGSYKKTKAIYSIYSMLSDYGTHKNRFDFFYFGSAIEEAESDGAKSVMVDFNCPNSLGMVEQLKKNRIDIAFLWSKCQETYSYTYYEAFEAGCWIVTSTHSGNITDQVLKNGNGRCFDTVEDCATFLKKLQGDIDVLRIDDVKINCNTDDFAPQSFGGENMKYRRGKRPQFLVSLLYKSLRRPAMKSQA